MSTIKSSDEHLTLNADGSSKDIKFQANGVEKASIDSSGNLTVSGNLTSVGIDDNADATAITIDSSERVGIGAAPAYLLDVHSTATSGTTVTANLSNDKYGVATGYTALQIGTQYDDGSSRIVSRNNTGNQSELTLQPHAAASGVWTDAMIINSNGYVTMPSQPAFYAGSAASQVNIALDTNVTVVLTNEIFDLGSNFASNTFTAPVTGKYQFTANMRLDSIDSAANYYSLKIITSNRSYFTLVDPDYGADLNYAHFSLSVLADMDAGDTAYVAITQAGGSAQSDIDGDTKYTNFSGYLVA